MTEVIVTIIYVGIVLTLASIGYFQGWAKTDFLLGALLSVLLPFIKFIVERRNNIRIFLRSFWIAKIEKKELRVSFAYLIRLKIGDKYLLTKNSRFNAFQPIGGVYQIVNETHYARFKLRHDTAFNDVPPKDFRRILPNPFEALNLLDLFHKKVGIEFGPGREFFEEVIEEYPALSGDFKNIVFEFKENVTQPIKYSIHTKYHELKSFDVFEAHLSHEQEQKLLNAIAANGNSFIWATDHEIHSMRKQTPNGELAITDHSALIT